MKRFQRIGLFVTCIASLCLLVCLMGATIGPWPVVGNLGVTSGSTLSTSQQGYALVKSGTMAANYFSFNNTFGTATLTSVCLSSGGTAQTSVPCNYLSLQLAGTGVLTTGGSYGIAFVTSGTACGSGAMTLGGGTANAQAQDLRMTIPVSNINQLFLTGTGSCSYIYGN